MNIGEITRSIAVLANANGNAPEWTPEYLNRIYEMVNWDILRNIYGYPNEFMGAETNSKKSDSLRKIKSEPTTIALTAGVGDLPDDYLYRLKATASGRNIDFVTELEDGERQSSSVEMASTRYPTAIINESTISVKPTTIASISLVYYKIPTDPVYAVTLSNGIYVYDANSSTDFDWGPEHDVDIIWYALGHLNIPVSRENVLQYINNKKMTEK